MKFHYYKSAKQRAIEGMVITSLFVLLLLGAAYFLVFIKKEPGVLKFLDSFVVWLLCGVTLVLYWISFRLYKSPDYWEIKVTDSDVIWDTPEKAPGEKNFAVSLSEIEQITCEESIFTDGSNSYSLHLIDGEEIMLNHSLSGLNINKFIKALEKSGIRYELIKPNKDWQ